VRTEHEPDATKGAAAAAAVTLTGAAAVVSFQVLQ